MTAQTSFSEFKFRLNEDLGTLDWGYGEINGTIVQQLMEGLTLSDKDGKPVPAIAKKWRFMPGKQPSFIFHLDPKSAWSDGAPVCAQHFIDAWKRVLDPGFASPYAHYLFDVKNAKAFHSGKERDASTLGLEALGCHTLKVLLEKPASYFAAITSHWVLFPIRKDLIENAPREWTRPGKLVVNGPYLLSEWAPDQHYVLKRNPKYHGRPAFEETLKAVVVREDATAFNLFQDKRLDWVKDLPFLEKPRLSSTPEYKLFPTLVGYHIGFRPDVPRNIRCALSKSLNKDEIPQVLKGGETPAWGVVPAELARYAPKSHYDPVQAKKLWDQTEDKTWEAHYYSKDIHTPLMEWAQSQWKKNLGAEVNLKRMEGKTYWSFLQKSPPQIFLSGTTAAYAHPYTFLSEFLSQSHANWGRFASAPYDRAAMKTSELLAGSQLKPWVEKAQKILIEDQCAVIPLYFRQTASLVSKDWNGFHVNPMTYVYLKDVRKRTPDMATKP
ncbi:MAG: peptide ABC transporter substrate-binding protein [Bdellovibrionota bacterium]